MSCAPSDEEVVRQIVTEDFDKLKTLDSDLVSDLMTNENFSSLAECGVDPEAFLRSYLKGFDYHIEDIKVDKDTAEVTLTITRKTISSFLEKFDALTNEMDMSTSFANATQEEIVQSIAQMCMEAIDTIEPAQSSPFKLSMVRRDKTWVLSNEGKRNFVDVLLGEESN